MTSVYENPSSTSAEDYEVSRYKLWLQERVAKGSYIPANKDNGVIGTLSDENVWGLKAGAPITQAVLNDAFNRQQEVINYFAQCGITAKGLPTAKTWPEVKLDRARGFNAYKDAMTVRVPYFRVDEASTLRDKVLSAIKSVKGSVHVHYERDGPDIVDFVNWYQPGIGHTIQVQVLHMFAMITFDQDSLIKRAKANSRPPSRPKAGYIDLWDEGLYINVREALVNRWSWEKVWCQNPEALWRNRLEELMVQVHSNTDSQEYRQDERLVRQVDNVLECSFEFKELNLTAFI